MLEGEEQSFLGKLLRKKADMLRIGDKTGKNVKGALTEVDRQIKEALDGDAMTGKGVTKSGEED